MSEDESGRNKANDSPPGINFMYKTMARDPSKRRVKPTPTVELFPLTLESESEDSDFKIDEDAEDSDSGSGDTSESDDSDENEESDEDESETENNTSVNGNSAVQGAAVQGSNMNLKICQHSIFEKVANTTIMFLRCAK